MIQAIISEIGSHGLVETVLALILAVWAGIAIRDKNSWARKLFEVGPQGVVSAVNYVVSLVARPGEKSTKTKFERRPIKADNFDNEFWDDEFSMNKTLTKKYAKIVSAMPPT